MSAIEQSTNDEHLNNPVLRELAIELDKLRRTPPTFEVPQIFNLAKLEDQIALQGLVRAEAIRDVYDPLEELATVVFEYRYPAGTEKEKEEYIHSVIEEQQYSFGNFVYYPTTHELVRFAEQEDHFGIRTFRNRNLVTAEEQREHHENKAVLFEGLSVGSAAVHEFAKAGIGDHYLLADNDIVDPMGFNRRAGKGSDVGMLKTDQVAQAVVALDPWTKLTLLRNGVNPAVYDSLSSTKIDLIVEAMDDMPAKARSRKEAERRGVPHIMTGDFARNAIVEVERYDKAERKKIAFGGKLSDEQISRLVISRKGEDDTTAKQRGALTRAEQERYMLKHAGILSLSPRMMQSIMAMGVTLGGFPQLGVTADRAGANAAFAAQQIFLDHDLPSGRYVDKQRKALRAGPEVSAIEALTTVIRLARYAKNR